MTDRNDRVTDEQLQLMLQILELLDDARYSDALEALVTVQGQLICEGAPSQTVALDIARKFGDTLMRLVELHFEEVNGPTAGGVRLQ